MFGQQSAWRTAALFASAGASLANTLATRAATTATVQDTTATNVNAAAKGRATLATKLAAGAQRVLNLAMRANPIGLIITAITLLVGGLVLAYQKSETFRNIVNGIGTAIMSVVRPAIDWFTGTALPALGAFTMWVGEQFLKLWPIIKTAFDIAVAVVTDFIGRISQYFQGGFQVLTGIFDFFKNLFTGNWSGLRDSVLQIAGGLWDMLGGIFGTGRDRALEFVLGLRDRAVTAVTNMKDWIVERVQGLWNGVVEKVTGLRDGAVAIFEGLRDKATELGKAMADQFGRELDSLRGLAARPIKFVVETVMNDGIIKAYNSVAADIFRLPRIPNIPLGPLAGWDRGGWTGPGHRLQPAGIVHADEFVVQKSSRRRLEGQRPGALDYMNTTGQWPGYADGGRVLYMPGYAPGGRVHPVPGWGVNWGRGYHGVDRGLDIPAPMGTAVVAMRDSSVVSTARWNRSYGWHIRTSDGAVYAHLSGINVAPGQAVRAGQVIGRVGSTGNSTGPHLHVTAYDGRSAIGAAIAGVQSFIDHVGEFSDKIAGPMRRLGEIGDTPFAQMGRKVPELISEEMKKKLSEFAGVFDAPSDTITATGGMTGTTTGTRGVQAPRININATGSNARTNALLEELITTLAAKDDKEDENLVLSGDISISIDGREIRRITRQELRATTKRQVDVA